MMITKWVMMVVAGVDLRENPLNDVPRSPVATSLDNVSMNWCISSIDDPVVTGVMVGEMATSMMQSAISAGQDRDDTRSIRTLAVGEHRKSF